jgi:hypothetical protein
LNINCAFPTYSTYKLGLNGENKKEICTGFSYQKKYFVKNNEKEKIIKGQ